MIIPLVDVEQLVQRIPRYKLFLRELKNDMGDGEHKTAIGEALRKVCGGLRMSMCVVDLFGL